MDWQLAASIAAVTVPVATAMVLVIDMRVRLLIRMNNDDLINRINGTYVRKEVCDATHRRDKDSEIRRFPFGPPPQPGGSLGFYPYGGGQPGRQSE